eukprot:UN08984
MMTKNPNLNVFLFLVCSERRIAKKLLFEVIGILNKHIFGLEVKIFCLHLKVHMLMSWKPTSNNPQCFFPYFYRKNFPWIFEDRKND